MRVKLAYGKEGLWTELPDRNVTVVEPKHVTAVPDEGPMIRWLSFSAISPVPSLAG